MYWDNGLSLKADRKAVSAATTTIQNVRVQDVLQLGTGVPLFKTTTALTP